MVFLVGGYKLTREEVLEWCQPRGIDPPRGNITVFVNRWLRQHGIRRTRLLACVYEKSAIFLLVIDRKIAPHETPDNYTPFTESDEAQEIKQHVGVNAEFVTVADPYGSY